MTDGGLAVAEKGVSRRRFLGYLIAAPTLVAAAELTAIDQAQAAVPTTQPVDLYDLSDLLTDAGRPTANLISIAVNPDGTVSFALPRAEVGQGITTAVAMTIAEEMDVPVDKVHVTLADARPELIWNQITGGSNTMHSIFTPVRVAAAIARGALLEAAAGPAGRHGRAADREGRRDHRAGREDGHLRRAGRAKAAGCQTTATVSAQLKPRSQFRVVGTPQQRVDALDIVTGRKRFAMDLDVPDALPTMVCRPPTINGTRRSVRNLAPVKAMPGITDVAIIPHTRTSPAAWPFAATTFGQCIDAIRALSVDWGPGTGGRQVRRQRARRPEEGRAPADAAGQPARQDDRPALHVPLPPRRPARDELRDRRRAAGQRRGLVEPQDADLGPGADRLDLGLPVSSVTVHVTAGRRLVRAPPVRRRRLRGRRHLEGDRQAGQADVAPHGQLPPGPRPPDDHLARARRSTSAGNVLTFDQRNTGVATDLHHGLGELLSAKLAEPGVGNLGYAQFFFTLTANVPYNFGVVTQLLNEVYEPGTFNTSSRPQRLQPRGHHAEGADGRPARQGDGQGPVPVPARVRPRDARMRAVLDKVAQVGNWGRAMPAGTAQGIAIHREYKGYAACLVEIDCRPATVNRKVERRLHRAAGDEGRVRGRRRPADQPARPRGADDGRDHGRDRARR